MKALQSTEKDRAEALLDEHEDVESAEKIIVQASVDSISPSFLRDCQGMQPTLIFSLPLHLRLTSDVRWEQREVGTAVTS